MDFSKLSAGISGISFNYSILVDKLNFCNISRLAYEKLLDYEGIRKTKLSDSRGKDLSDTDIENSNIYPK